MSEKRTLCQLLDPEGYVHLHVANETLWKMFLTQAAAEGFEWEDRSDPWEKRRSDAVTLNDNMTISYLHPGFSPGPRPKICKVDYARYINYVEDYLYDPERRQRAADARIRALADSLP